MLISNISIDYLLCVRNGSNSFLIHLCSFIKLCEEIFRDEQIGTERLFAKATQLRHKEVKLLSQDNTELNQPMISGTLNSKIVFLT